MVRSLLNAGFQLSNTLTALIASGANERSKIDQRNATVLLEDQTRSKIIQTPSTFFFFFLDRGGGVMFIPARDYTSGRSTDIYTRGNKYQRCKSIIEKASQMSKIKWGI